MNSYLRVLGTLLALLGLPVSAQAQDCQSFTKTPPTGSWAEWRGVKDFMIQAMLGEEMREGKAYIRTELRGGEDKQIMLTIQTLAPKEQLQSPEEMIVKMGRMIPMKVPKESLKKAGPMPVDPSLESCATNMALIGQETITVPAGTFMTFHYKDAKTGNESWLSPQVPFGIVKLRIVGTGESTLFAFGTGAKSAITEAPIDMPRE